MAGPETQKKKKTIASGSAIRRRFGISETLLMPVLQLWIATVRSYRNISAVRWLILGVVVGVVTGLSAILFFAGVEYFKFLFLHVWAGFTLPEPAGEGLFHAHAGGYRPWLIPIYTTSVALMTGYLVKRYVPETVYAGTDGTDGMIKAFHQQGGIITPKVPLIRGISSIFTIAAGGSAGREGPISQIGAGIGSWLAVKMKLSARERRILLLAGAAGGLGAIFRAPLGGALTAIEVIYLEDFEAEAILPAVLSSVVSYSLFTLIYTTEPIFGIPTFYFRSVLELPFYIMLALACSLSGWFYIKTFFFIKYKVFFKLHKKFGITLTMALGGLLMGLLGMYMPEVLTGGYGWLEDAILGEMTVKALFVILILKTLATSFTIGSGMSGGMFAPALFVGGVSGGLVGFAGNHFFPHIITQPGAFVLVGMAAFFAGVANAPIGPLIMVCELTQGYGLLAPLMLASAICLVLNRNISLYENQVDSKFESPAHISDSTINILEKLQVKEFYRPGDITTISESTSLKSLTKIISETDEKIFPIVNNKWEFTGILTIHDAREVLFEDSVYDLLLAKDFAKPIAYMRPDYDLYSALMKFVETNLEQIPVVDTDNLIVGILDRDDVFKAYSNAMKSLKEGA